VKSASNEMVDPAAAPAWTRHRIPRASRSRRQTTHSCSARRWACRAVASALK